MLQQKNNIKFVTEFPCLLEHPVCLERLNQGYHFEELVNIFQEKVYLGSTQVLNFREIDPWGLKKN